MSDFQRTMWQKGRGIVTAGVAIATLLVSGGVQHAQSVPIEQDLDYLAHDDRGGRVTGQPGWSQAFTYIHDAMLQAGIAHGNIIAQTTPGDGSNLFGRIDGSDPERRNQYVLIGAHYDHVSFGPLCNDPVGAAPETPAICNGATDNAAGVAVVLEIIRQLAQGPAPARSVVFAFWDREEIDLGGSSQFRDYPLPPPFPQQLVTYVNYDIQGANLLSSLRSTTFAVGASSGGTELQTAVTSAASGSGLTLRQLSEPLGLYASDYATFLAPATVNRTHGHPDADLERIPTVFFTDSRGPCYHTTQDEAGVVDRGKLARQAAIGTRLVRDLTSRASPPVIVGYDSLQNANFAARVATIAKDLSPYVPALVGFDPGPIPPPTRADAVQLLAIAQAARSDQALALDTNAQSIISEQIRILNMILYGQAGYYAPLFWYRSWARRAAGPYRPVDDGVFVALAAMQAMAVIQNVPCSGFLAN
jgi:hypothetical protein